MAFLLASCSCRREFVPLNGFFFSSRNPFRISGYPDCLGFQQGKFRHLGPFVLHSSPIEPEKEQRQTVSNSEDVRNRVASTEQAIVDKGDGTFVCEDSTPGSGAIDPLEKNTELPTKPQRRLRSSVKERAKVSLPISAIGQLNRFFESLQKFLAPRHKGDIRDVILMSLSFAVYVYISQQIVCAYCMWRSMFTH